MLTSGDQLWRIYYGIVDGKRPAVRVTDRVSGRSVPVKAGRLFAIAVPGSPDRDAERLVAFDRNGRVVADENRPLR